ncbi:Aminoglycoside phosphotransferase [Macrophomina phaseolina MS6]|uniref:Aminoglycoside phosphotransferase n=1 Tax=Macrophomina phaseolina (strain MS6) TaxID=1126212 RepID=K2SAZ1_MACPH|nr:Aminoglycoside phosphotransferase [Macrophomina phaseolina MS6]
MAGEVRQPIDVAALSSYIDANVPEIKTPIDVKQFGYGQSNPTYLLTSVPTGSKFVLRKKPPGQLLSKTAHKVDREYRIIAALSKTDVPVPKAYCLCEDDAVIGTAFYIMEFLDGRIFEDPALPDVSVEDRTKMWHDAVRTLAKFHRINPSSINMSNYGKPSGFYNRQLATFATISSAQAQTRDVDSGAPVGKIPHYDDMVAFFSDARAQPRDRSTFVHGDYKIDNVVFHKTEPRVIGILDWEMSTIGHPLSDLSNLLAPYVTASADVTIGAGGRGTQNFRPGATPGLPAHEDLVALYAETAGWDPAPDMTWGEAFNLYRGAVILQGIAARYARRQASSLKAKEYGEGMGPMGELAWNLVQKAKNAEGKAKL